MGIFTDFYIADESSLQTLFGWVKPSAVGKEPTFDEANSEGFAQQFDDWLAQQPHPEPTETDLARLRSLDSLEYKGVSPGALSALRHVLLGTEIDVGGNSLMLAPDLSYDLHEVSSDLVQAVASVPEAELIALAERWAKHEEVGWSEEHAREFVPQFARLARAAITRDQNIYLLISGYV